MADNNDDKKKKGQNQQKDLAHEPGIISGVFKQLLGDVAEQWPEHQDFKYLEKIQAFLDERFGEKLGQFIVTTGVGITTPALQATLLGFGVPSGVVWSVSDIFKDFTDGVRRTHREKGRVTQGDLSKLQGELVQKYQQRAKEETSYSEMAQQLPEASRLELQHKIEAFIGGSDAQRLRFDWWRRQIKTTHMLDTLIRLPVIEWEAHLKQIIGDPPVEKPKVDNSLLTKGMKTLGGFAQRNAEDLLLGHETPGSEVEEIKQRVASTNDKMRQSNIKKALRLQEIKGNR